MDPTIPKNDIDGANNHENCKAKQSLDELQDNLDALWISYLNHLDAYTSTQKILQKHLSDGFLSLARANFNARSGIRKYGQDYYHERAIATKRVGISQEVDGSRPTVEVIRWTPPINESDEDSEEPVEIEKTSKKEEDVTQLPSPPGTPESEADTETSPSSREAESVGKRSHKLPLEADSLKWFGILVPPALRSSATSFQAAVDAVVDATNSARAMRTTEVEIRKLRKDIRRVEMESRVA